MGYTRRRIRKTKSNIARNSKHKLGTRRSSINACLPSDMIVEVLARVGASSQADLFRCKLSCKVFGEVAEEKLVLKQVSLEKISYVWLRSDKAESFVKRCSENNNSESLFQIGMVQYFTRLNLEEGKRFLVRAAIEGHIGATYVLGLILLCSEHEDTKKRGVELIMNLVEVIKGKGIVECRRRLYDDIQRLSWFCKWIDKYVKIHHKPEITCPKSQEHQTRSNWDRDCDYDGELEDKDVICEACRCSREVDFFHRYLK